MHKGGALAGKKIDQAFRFAALFVPSLLLVYGVLIDYEAMPSHSYAGFKTLILITVPGILLAAYLFLFWKGKSRQLAISLVLFHLYAGAYALLISGFVSPFTVAWLLLQMAAYAYFGVRGLKVSLMAFFAIATLDAFKLAFELKPLAFSLASILAGVTMVLVSVVIVATIDHFRSKAVSPSSVIKDDLEVNRLLTIVNNMADGFFSVDSSGKVLLYNAAAMNLLDTNQTLTGKNINTVLPLTTNDGDSIDIFKWLSDARGLTIRDDVLLSQDEEDLRLELTYSPVRSNVMTDGSGVKANDYIVLIRDITKEKTLSEERDEFISVVSHELRTPLTVAEGSLSNLQLMIEQPKSKKQALSASLDQAHEQIMFLSKLVNDLSTLSRAERGLGDEIEKIDLKKLAEDIYREYMAQAEEHGLTLDLDLSAELGSLKTSHLYLKELLQNLLSNAIKYTKEGGVTLQVSKQKDSVKFAVTDTGIGISKHDQKQLFSRFYRSEDFRTRETGGTGLGLYVASKLARKIGATIKVDSRLNYGSTFYFTLSSTDES